MIEPAFTAASVERLVSCEAGMKIVSIVVDVIVFAFVFCPLVAWPFMWIWNYAVVAAVSVTKPIGYWVAFWLMMFISLVVAGSRLGSKSSS